MTSAVSEAPPGPAPVRNAKNRTSPTTPAPVGAGPSKSVVWACLLPVVVGLAARGFVAFGWLHGTEAYNDAADYFLESTKLCQRIREATPYYWPPGTSYYLMGWFAVFGSSMTVARVAMIVLSSLQIAVVAGLTFQATSNARVTVLSAWLWALYPPSVLLVFQPFSQHLAAFSLAAIAWTGLNWFRTQSWRWLVSLGILLGIGCLARPSMMSVVLMTACSVFVLALIRFGLDWQKMKSASIQSLLLCGIAGAVLAPTILHNAKTGGGYSLSTNNERNFFLGNNPYTPWYKTSHFAQRHLDELPPETAEYLRSYYQKPNPRAAMKEAAIQHLVDRPDLAVLRTLNRARSFWGFDYLASRAIQGTAHPTRIASLFVLVAEAGGYCLIMVCALLALTQCQGRMDRMAVVWFLVTICAYAGPYCLAFSSGTYHFPVMGLVVPFAAIGLDSLRHGGWRQALGSVRVWGVSLIFVAIQVEYAYCTLMLSNATI